MFSVLLRLIADLAFIAIVLFIPAGTLSWERAWVLLAVMLIVRGVSTVAVYRVNPALLRERVRPPIRRDQPRSDKLLLLAVIATGFIGVPAVAGADVFRWRLLPHPGALVADAGLVLFVLGWTMMGIALRTNAFATSVVRLQTERQHSVVDTGVYGIIRHPFYAGTPLVLVGMGLWLESYAAVLCAVLATVFVILRLKQEERFLKRELPGYTEYVARVRYRLLPGIW